MSEHTAVDTFLLVLVIGTGILCLPIQVQSFDIEPRSLTVAAPLLLSEDIGR